MSDDHSPTGRQLTRRRAVASIGAAATALAHLPASASASATATYADDVRAVMEEYDVKGVSVAIVTPGGGEGDESPVYQEAFGVDRDQRTFSLPNAELTPEHRLRVASVAKTLTSAAILRLIEAGDLHPSEPIFGEHGYLPTEEWGEPDTDCPLTIRRLLEHAYEVREDETADWVRVVYRAPEGLTLPETISYVHDEYTVQTSYARHSNLGVCSWPDEYYNYGYALLAAVVDTVVGEEGYQNGNAFETYVKEELLAPAGASGIDTVRTQHGAVENEAFHHSKDGNPYAEWLVREIAWGWSAWAGTATEVARFGQWAVASEPFPSVIDEFRDLADFGWETAHEETYVGHVGHQVGLMAALRCRPERAFAVLCNTRHGETWEEKTAPLDELSQRTHHLAEELT